jgi:hypothetical protein
MPDDRALRAQPETMKTERQKRLEVVAASPERAGAHDREGWFELFADGASVEDPVGTPPCRKGQRTAGLFRREDELLAFYDAFIARNEIRFEVHQDVVVGLSVARDVTIHTRMSPGFVSSVRAHLLYELAPERESFRIARLAAHWEASGSTRQAMAGGLRGPLAMGLSVARMVRHIGPTGTRAYVRGTKSGVRRGGREAVLAFAEVVSGRSRASLDSLVTPRATLALGDEGDRPCHGLASSVPDLALRVWDLSASGYTVSCRCEVVRGGDTYRGLGFFHFDRPTRTIARARLLYER